MVLAWSTGGWAWSQLPDARLNTVFPPGGEAGQVVAVTLTGANLDDAERVRFSHPAVTAEPQQSEPDPFLKQQRRLPRQFRVSIGGDVKPGIYEIWTVGRAGVSNPRAFMVGGLSELTKLGEPNTPEQAQLVSINATVNGQAQEARYDFYALDLQEGQEVTFEVWAERIDSQMDATLALFDDQGSELALCRNYRGLDPRIRFVAQQTGRHVVRIHDFLFRGGGNYFYRLTATDAPQMPFAFPPAVTQSEPQEVSFSSVPQPAQAASALVDAPSRKVMTIAGRGVAPDDPWRLRRPWDFGHSEFVTRPAGSQPHLEPTWIRLVEDRLVPELASSSSPQALEPPCVVVGQFHPSRDVDSFEFAATAGEEFWLEVQSRRLGYATDPTLVVQRLSDDGSPPVDVLESDDGPALPGSFGFDRGSRDPLVLLKVPETGRYRIELQDLFTAGPDATPKPYLLGIRKPRPNFHLLTLADSPWKPNAAQPLRWRPPLRRGGTMVIPVLVIRSDGFNGQVRLALEGLPAGVTCEETLVDAAQTRGDLILVASDSAPEWVGEVQIVGRSEYQGHSYERTAEHATLIWDSPGNDAEAPTRLTSRFKLCVVDEIAPVSMELETPEMVTTCRTGKLELPLRVTKRGELKEKLQLGALHLPKGMQAEFQMDDEQSAGQCRINVSPEVVPGRYSVYVTGKVKVVYRQNPELAEQAAVYQQALTELNEAWTADKESHTPTELEQLQQALKVATEKAEQRKKAAEPKDRSMHLVTRSFALHVAAAPISIELPAHRSTPAGQADVPVEVQIERQFGFEGAVQLRVAEPEKLAGISVSPVEIPAGSNDGTLTVVVAEDAPAGAQQLNVEFQLENNGHALTIQRALTLEIASSS